MNSLARFDLTFIREAVAEKQLSNYVRLKGEVRNSYRKPVGSRSMKTVIRQVLENYPLPRRNEDAEFEIWAKAVEQAINGDRHARMDIAAYLYGKPVQYIETTDIPETDEEKRDRLQASIERREAEIEAKIAEEVERRISQTKICTR